MYLGLLLSTFQYLHVVDANVGIPMFGNVTAGRNVSMWCIPAVSHRLQLQMCHRPSFGRFVT